MQLRTSSLALAGLLVGLFASTDAQASPAVASPSAVRAASLRADEVEDLIERGRTLLDTGRPAEAEALFEEAAAKDDGSLRTRMWVLRAWMDQGRNNDTLNAIDELKAAGHAGPELDYLYGMAFMRRAEKMIAEGTFGNGLQMNLRDGYELLARVVPAHERRFRDGWLTLARAAWYEASNREGAEAAEVRAVARDAADRAVAFYPDHADAHLMRGRVALTQFAAELPEGAAGPDEWGPAAPHWEAARRSFAAALELVEPTPEDATAQMLTATAAMQLGNTYGWKAQRAEAAQAYARGIGWAPWGIDFQTVYNTLYAPEADAPYAHVLAALDAGQAAYEQHFGPETQADATTLWWRGWVRLTAGTGDAGAEADFERVLAKWPAYVDAWYYLALARYGQQDFAGAVEALVSGWRTEPTTMLARVQEGDPELNVARVEYLKGWAFQEGRIEQAIPLARLSAEAQPDLAVRWNDVGLFLRDRGDQLRREHGAEVDAAELARLDEEALEAYERALELEPENPQLLNDTAVMLHYYLQRDLDRAEEMYVRAAELAEAHLASDELDEETRASYETALRDARNNLAALREARGDGASGSAG